MDDIQEEGIGFKWASLFPAILIIITTTTTATTSPP
jgi:hypothetical protein